MPPNKRSQAREEIGQNVFSVAQGFGTPSHPTAAASRKARPDFFDLDPKRITESGPYVREIDFNDDFEAFCASVRERGQIDQPISVRRDGDSSQFILVWGKRRLHAALRLGLEKIPVRNLGDVDDVDAMKLQLQENLARKSMSAVERALSFWELSSRGLTNPDIASVIGKSVSYISYMTKTGEGIAALTEDERRELNQRDVLSVRACQLIAQHETIADRAAALRQLLVHPEAASRDAQESERVDPERSGNQVEVNTTRETASAPRDPASTSLGSRPSRPDEEAPFVVKDLRGGQGRTFRVRWYNRDLRENPEDFVAQLVERVKMEQQLLINRLESLEHTALSGAMPDQRMAERLGRARQALKDSMTNSVAS